MTKRHPPPEATAERPWSVPLARAEVPETGRHVALAADEHARAAIAKLANLQALPRLTASFDITPHGAEGLRVSGRISAMVGQTCVVTLEPIENVVEETIDLVCSPAGDTAVVDAVEPINVEIDDAQEAIVNGVVDLGAIATEFLILGLDPYPRKPGAVFEPPAAGDPADSPFAALAALKPRPGGQG